MSKPIKIQSVNYPRAFFKPGELAQWTIIIYSDVSSEVNVITTITFLDMVVDMSHQKANLNSGITMIKGKWNPPNNAPCGYGLDIRLETLQGLWIESYTTAFDVLDYWFQNPRYGFLTDFRPNRTDGSQALDNLLQYHINGLQFYDWMYRHDQYLTRDDPYFDPLGRKLSIITINSLILAAHERGMAAMPYTAVYAASIPFFTLHQDWALYKIDGRPEFFGENFLVLMDPRQNSPWTRHLLSEFKQVLNETGFDGIHLDQYGSPKTSFDVYGHSIPLDQPMADMINATKDLVTSARGEGGAVVFNAVSNWPIEKVAPSKEDLIYIEVWSPYNSYNDLHSLVIQGQFLGGGKPVVIAAYIDPDYQVNARLIDAIIFSSGASHIELGEQGGYLSDAYFPKNKILSRELSQILRRYYEFAIRYENVIGPQSQSADKKYANQISITGVNVSLSAEHNKIMPVIRVNGDYLAVNFINMLGLETGEWAKDTSIFPTTLDEIEVEISGISKQVKSVWFASPDKPEFSLTHLDFHQNNDLLIFNIPFLEIWDMILINLGE